MNASASPPRPGIAAERMAALVASRLCHDLVSPLGAIGNGVELIEMGGQPASGRSPEMALISDSVAAARARIRVFRVAFGHTAPDQRMSMNELQGLLRDMAEGSRLQLQLDAQGDLPRTEARMILLAVMCLETSLPWGGRVLICRGTQGWRLVAEAERPPRARAVGVAIPAAGGGPAGAGRLGRAVRPAGRPRCRRAPSAGGRAGRERRRDLVLNAWSGRQGRALTDEWCRRR